MGGPSTESPVRLERRVGEADTRALLMPVLAVVVLFATGCEETVGPLVAARPQVTAVTPNSSPGHPSFAGPLEVRLTGVDFHPETIVRMHGGTLCTGIGGYYPEPTVASSTEIVVDIHSDWFLTSPRTVKLCVFTPEPGGGWSNHVDFEILAP